MSGTRWLPVGLWVALILTVTSVPTIPVPGRAGTDKLGHFALYFVLGVLSARAAENARSGPRAAAIAALVAIALFAAADEWHQRFIPHRSAEVADWIADVGGAAVGIAAYTWLRARRSRAR